MESHTVHKREKTNLSIQSWEVEFHFLIYLLIKSSIFRPSPFHRRLGGGCPKIKIVRLLDFRHTVSMEMAFIIMTLGMKRQNRQRYNSRQSVQWIRDEEINSQIRLIAIFFWFSAKCSKWLLFSAESCTIAWITTAGIPEQQDSLHLRHIYKYSCELNGKQVKNWSSQESENVQFHAGQVSMNRTLGDSNSGCCLNCQSIQ